MNGRLRIFAYFVGEDVSSILVRARVQESFASSFFAPLMVLVGSGRAREGEKDRQSSISTVFESATGNGRQQLKPARIIAAIVRVCAGTVGVSAMNSLSELFAKKLSMSNGAAAADASEAVEDLYGLGDMTAAAQRDCRNDKRYRHRRRPRHPGNCRRRRRGRGRVDRSEGKDRRVRHGQTMIASDSGDGPALLKARLMTKQLFAAVDDRELKEMVECFLFHEIRCKESHGAMRALPNTHQLYELGRRHAEKAFPREPNERWSTRHMRSSFQRAFGRTIGCITYHLKN